MAAVTILSVVALGSPGYAEQAPSGAASTPTAGALTVTAPRVVRRKAQGAGRFQGTPVEVLSLSQPVNFGDLDLTTSMGVDEFKKRILYAAWNTCNRLESEYPSNVYVPVPADQNCPDDTARAALVVADSIIAAARAH